MRPFSLLTRYYFIHNFFIIVIFLFVTSCDKLIGEVSTYEFMN